MDSVTPAASGLNFDIGSFFALFDGLTEVLWTVVVAIITMTAGWIIGKIAKQALLGILRKREIGSEALARFLSDMARYVILAVAVIAAIEKMGVQTTSVLTILASAGLAVGLALQGSLSHFASGVMLLIFRPFDIGDVVTAGGSTGQITEIGLFATTLVTPDQEKIIVPNGAIASGTITNITALGVRRGVIDVGVAYGTDVDRVVGLLTRVVSGLPQVLEDRGVGVAFTNMGASAVEFKVLYFTKGEDFLPAMHDARKACYDALNAEGIEIPFNQIVVHQASADA
jgi:small conductance mechanosensitive channel